MTSKQKGEVLERESGRFQLVRQNGEYAFRREDGTMSDFKLRRCPECGHIGILFLGGRDGAIQCQECGEFSEAS